MLLQLGADAIHIRHLDREQRPDTGYAACHRDRLDQSGHLLTPEQAIIIGPSRTTADASSW
ncbi:hypothetical protein [Nonomuraea jabiensis]|uniref:hypothetical protein n=1 Tax=Nonomuraea jabiensis TaxID=882448 RepID=UPI0036970F8C